MKKLLRQIVERFGYRYFKIAYQPIGLDHAHDVARFLGSAPSLKVVFDVGANEGQTATHYVRAFPSAQIYSFEPVASTYQSLVQHLSKYPRVRPFQLAFADRNRRARIQILGVSGLNSLRNELTDGSSSCSELVTIRTLESFCAEHEISHIDLLKIDTEGFELEVLKGAEAMLRARQIQFIIAEVTFHPADRVHTSFSRLAEYLYGLEYFFFDIYDDDGIASFSRPPLPSCNALFSCVPMGRINVPAVAFRGA